MPPTPTALLPWSTEVFFTVCPRCAGPIRLVIDFRSRRADGLRGRYECAQLTGCAWRSGWLTGQFLLAAHERTVERARRVTA